MPPTKTDAGGDPVFRPAVGTGEGYSTVRKRVP